MTTTTFCPTLHWQTCTKTMEKLWGFSSQSSQPTSLVGENQHFIETDTVQKRNTKMWWVFFFSCRLFFLLFTEPTKNNHRSDFHNYLAGSTDFGNVSYEVPVIHPFFYIGTDALNHTEEYTEAAGTAACFYWEQMFALMKLSCIRWSSNVFSPHLFPGHLVCLFGFLFTHCLFFSSARSWEGPVVHPEDSQSPGYDSCGCSVLPCSATASEGGLQARQTEAGEITCSMKTMTSLIRVGNASVSMAN